MLGKCELLALLLVSITSYDLKQVLHLSEPQSGQHRYINHLAGVVVRVSGSCEVPRTTSYQCQTGLVAAIINFIL